MTAEHIRLEEEQVQKIPWKKWGPYLSERQWGTVREDYSDNGDAWNFRLNGLGVLQRQCAGIAVTAMIAAASDVAGPDQD